MVSAIVAAMVKCAHCGMLAVRKVSDRQVVSAPEDIRLSYKNPPDRASGNRYSTYEDTPICAAGALYFDREQGAPPDAVVLEFYKERDCADFVKWIPGLEPKDHLARKVQEEVLSSEEFRYRELLRREDQRDAEMRAREDKRDEEAKNRHRNELVVFGLVLGGLTLIGSMIEAGWIPKPW